MPATNLSIYQGDTVNFAGTASDPDGDATSVLWEFDDGGPASTLTATHTFLSEGQYTVTFTVTDSHGLADPTPATRTITVTYYSGY